MSSRRGDRRDRLDRLPARLGSSAGLASMDEGELLGPPGTGWMVASIGAVSYHVHIHLF